MSDSPTCQCFTALPSGAVGPCGNGAAYRICDRRAQPVLCCEECRKEWREASRNWHTPLQLEVLATGETVDA